MTFTGSTQTGRLLAAHAGMHLKKTVLELGGSNPFIVMPDADLERAAVEACYSRFRDAGQSCNAAKRIVVTEAVADRFIPCFLPNAPNCKRAIPKTLQPRLPRCTAKTCAQTYMLKYRTQSHTVRRF